MNAATELRRVAILNRGEAAVRFIRAAREYNLEHGTEIRCIAFYTDPDANALYVRLADEAASLGPATSVGSDGRSVSTYCDTAAVVAALREADCDAVWPGWGFVSEDATFVRRLEAEGITFIGPSADAMERLGDKIAAKRLAEQVGAPVARWDDISEVSDPDDLVRRAEAVGFPLMVKASAGGGGRGIRRVDSAEGVLAAVEGARGEARRLFGDGGVFFEICIGGARHVEVQLVVDASGAASAVGVRDCSVQRRNQKVIEEAPSPVLPPETERSLCEAAERLAEAAGYRGVATAEFLYEAEHGRVSFLEVNSRLQVEHPLTEVVSGCDLVHAQLSVARGVPWARAGSPRGWAIEARLNAEDPEHGFRPAPGVLRVFRPPSGPGIRVDSGVTEGAAIAPEFDSMIAKVVAWGTSRPQAIARLARALREMDVVVDGGATNKAFLLELLGDKAFLDATLDTGWLDRASSADRRHLPPGENEALFAAAVLAYRAETRAEVERFLAQAQNGVPQNLPAPSGRLINLRLRGRRTALHVYAAGPDRYDIATPSGTYRARFELTGEHTAFLHLPDKRYRILFSFGPNGIAVEVDGAMHPVARSTGGEVRAPAPAMVVRLDVATGDRVEAGDRLCTLEAMKMEMPVYAEDPGIVRNVLVAPNEQVASGQVAMVIETLATGDDGEIPAVVFPPPPVRPLDLLFGSAMPSPERLDDAPRDVVAAVVDDVVRVVRTVMLGYDVPAEIAARIEVLFGARLEFAELRKKEVWAPLVELLGAFGDTESLFDRNLFPTGIQGAGVSPLLAFYEYCRCHVQGERGAPESIRAALARALAHFDVTDFTSDERLQEALWRMAVGHAHGDLRHHLASSLLRLVIGLHEVGSPIERTAGLQGVLDRVVRAASDEHPYVADNAHQALYVLYKQPGYVARTRPGSDSVDVPVVPGSPESDPAQSRFEAFARTAQTILPHLVRAAGPARRDAEHYLTTIVRRLYETRELELTPRARELGLILATGTVSPVGDEEPGGELVAVLTDFDSLVAAATASGETTARYVEVVIRAGTGESERLAGWAPDTGWVAEDGARVAITWIDDDDAVHHRTFIRTPGRWVEDDRFPGVHPEAARRMQLGRLSEFSLEPLPTPERLVAFHATAHANPRDERIVVYGEVFGLAAPLDGSTEDWPRWEFEKVYYEGLRVLRQEQAGRARRDRFYRNRLTITVHVPVEIGAKQVGEIAEVLEAPTRGLGLDGVRVRVSVVDDAGGTLRPVEYVISKPGRHRLDVRTVTPNSDAIPALTPYEQRVVRCRRLGLVYPYEIVGMLEGSESEGGSAVFAGRPGSFVEHDLCLDGHLVPVERPYGENTCGVIVGLISNPTDKYPEGMERVWIGSDPTRALGALGEQECRRVIAALDLAAERDVPVEWIPVSSGARIAMDSGTENLDWTAAVLRRIVAFTEERREINLIVPGINVGAQSYWGAESTMLLHTRGVLIMTADGALVLTGKKALEYSGSVSAEDEKAIGGYERIMGPNGQVQYIARDLGEAYATLFEHYRYAYVAPGEAAPRRLVTTDPADRSIFDSPYPGPSFDSVGEIFLESTNPGRKKPFAIRAVVEAVIDADGGALERWQPMDPAGAAVVYDAHVGGHPVSVIGFESQNLPRFGRVPVDGPERWTGGTLFPGSSKKVARALNVASGNRPVVVLANLSGFDGSPESLRRLQLEYGAEIARAVARFEGPLLFVVIGRYHGGAYVVFSKALNPNLQSIALEGTFASVIGGPPAAAVVFPREVRRRAEQDPRVVAAREALHAAAPIVKPRIREELDEIHDEVLLEMQGAVAAEFDAIHTIERAVRVGSLDAIIPPARLRTELIDRLDAAAAAVVGVTPDGGPVA